MSASRKVVNVFWQRLQPKLLGRSSARKEARAIGRDVIDISQKRTVSGRDRKGRQFRRYSRSYRRAKADMIAGRRRYPRGSRIDSKWKARRVRDVGRLSGETFSTMTTVRPKSLRQTFGADLFITITTNRKRTRERLEHLEAMGFDIFGLGPPGSSNGRRERRTILDRSKRRIKAQARAKGIVLQEE